MISDVIDDVIRGRKKNVVITISPGSSKTELVVINLIARGLAINPRARFLHLSGSDSLATLNSATARDIVRSDEYQNLWPLKIADDADSKKRWNVVVDGKTAGGVYATSIGGQVTGFRAGHMAPGFQGVIAIDDPLKPEEAFSKNKLEAANRKLITTVKSRRANPETPIILVMQRISENDPVALIQSGNLEGEWSHIRVPAVMDKSSVEALDPKYQKMIETSESVDGRFSYWPYKEPISQLLAMERGEGGDENGSKMSRHVFQSQYMQSPVLLDGNIIKSKYFIGYTVLPKILYRKVIADTAMKTGTANDFSVLACFGLGDDGKLYLIDMIRKKMESPELERNAISFWNKHLNQDAYPIDKYGQLRQFLIEEASSGVGLLQKFKLLNQIPIKGIIRVKDKVTRVYDVLAYIEAGMVAVPTNAPFTLDFLQECEAFSSSNTHKNDDQIDVLTDAITDMLSTKNKLELWKKLV